MNKENYIIDRRVFNNARKFHGYENTVLIVSAIENLTKCICDSVSELNPPKSGNKESPDSGKERQPSGEHNSAIDAISALRDMVEMVMTFIKMNPDVTISAIGMDTVNRAEDVLKQHQ
jgi:hypothetical protein